MKIRTYRENDKNDVISLWQDCGLVAPQNNPAKDIERKLKVDPDLFLVGISNNKIIATVMGGYEGHRGWINYLGVSPAEQRKGYGQAIMTAVEVLIKEKAALKSICRFALPIKMSSHSMSQWGMTLMVL